jgi:hypothetical protein
VSAAFHVAEGAAKAFLKSVPKPDRCFRLTFDFGAGEGTKYFYFKTLDTAELQVASKADDCDLLHDLVRDMAYAKHTGKEIERDDWDWLSTIEEVPQTPQEGWGVFEGSAKQFLKGLARRRKLEVGELVSSHTLNSRDLIQSFLEAIRNLSEETYAQVVDDEVEEYLRNEMPRAEAQDFEDDYLHEVLYSTLSGLCPPMTYFGAHPGNGSDIGCWPLASHEYEELAEEGKIIYASEGSRLDLELRAGQWPDFEQAKYLVHELEYGTYACYDRNRTKLWEGSL